MKAIRVWYAVDRDGEGYFYTGAPYRDVDSEMWNCDGEAYSATSELFNGVDPKYDSWDQVNDLHSKSSFSFPIPEGFSHTNGYIKFEIDVG